MADVKICDRCGKKVENHVPISLIPYRYVLIEDYRLATFEYDLCNRCRRDLKLFMKQAPSEETDGEVR